MNAFSKIDMGAVTRLTQAGKLAEAMALLQGHTASSIPRGSPGSEVPHSTHGIKRPSSPLPTINIVAPSAPGGAWTAPTQFKQRAAGESVRSGKAMGPPDLAQMMHAFRGLPKLGALSTVGDGFGPPQQAPVRVPEGARFEERTFSNDAGSRTYKVYVPSGYTVQSLPVVVMLHGCTQNPDDFAAGTRMNEVAEEQTFLVAYPRQPQSANMQKMLELVQRRRPAARERRAIADCWHRHAGHRGVLRRPGARLCGGSLGWRCSGGDRGGHLS